MNSNLAQGLYSLEHSFSAILKLWEEIIGLENVTTSSDILAKYGRSCGTRDLIPKAILKPASQEQVQQLVEIANHYGIALFPISCGKNWGYGSTVASSADNVILDLSRMNRILEVNTDLAYAIVEPGVTQQQLFEYLEQNKIPLTFDVTGSTTQASLVGNLLERGSGPSRYADHFLNSASMNVVLADGTLLKTGFGHFGDSQTAQVYRWGLGPYLDGIFTQSNFGIVTQCSIWLLPKPENFSLLIASFNSDSAMTQAIDRLRRLKLKGMIPNAIHIANDLRVISVLQNFPFDSSESSTHLSDIERTTLQKKWKVSSWNLLSSLEGTPAQIRADAKVITAELRDLCSIQIYSENLIAFMERYPILAKVVGQRDFKTKLSILRLMKGVPSDNAIRGVYWRKRYMPSSIGDPIRDQCGVMWCSPIVPMRQQEVSQFIKSLREICAAHQLDTNVSVTLLTERACCCTIGILFDRENHEEELRAKDCYRALLQTMTSLGFPPYRLGSDASTFLDLYPTENDPFWKVCSMIKSALDPRHILSPGKYGIA